MRNRFVKGMVIYAAIFLAVVAIGLGIFWAFIDAYENSRPLNTVKAYVASITPDDFCEGSEALLDQLDHRIQSREEACDIIRASVTEPLNYAKKTSESTEDRQVYVLRSGKQVIGQFTITAGEAEKFGFRVWSVTDKSFDFSHLLAQEASVTVPEEYTVQVNGTALDESYITKTGIEYTALEEFYDDYTLPEMVTYTATNILGEVNLEVLDADGNAVEISEDMDMNSLLPACDQAAAEEIDTLARNFLYHYVVYTSSSTGSVSYNYVRVIRHLVPECELAKRLATAMDGLQYAQSWGDTLKEVNVNRMADLGDGYYLCDLTYTVETYSRAGLVPQTSNVKLIIRETDLGLRIEAMTRY